MQDLSGDDLQVLSGSEAGTLSPDKDFCPTLICKTRNISPLNSTVANSTKHINSDGPSMGPIKVEDINTIDLLPSNLTTWQQYPVRDSDNHRSLSSTCNTFNRSSTMLLLQGSDDPLISHGANSVLSNDDEHPADFVKSLITHANNYFQNTINKKKTQEGLLKVSKQKNTSQRLVKSGCSSLTKQQLKVKANLMSVRNHLRQQNNNTFSASLSTTVNPLNEKKHQNEKTKNKKGTSLKLRFHHQALPSEYLNHFESTQDQEQISKNQQNFKINCQRIISKSANNLYKPYQPRSSQENVRSWLNKIAEIQKSANANATKEYASNQTEKHVEKSKCQPSAENIHQSQKTLNCILADPNKNYVTQKEFEAPNTKKVNISNSKRSHYSELPYMGEITLDNYKPRRGRKPKKADICHLIYKNYGTILPNIIKPENHSNCISSNVIIESDCLRKTLNEQPLNLCLRDQMNETYSVSSGDELSETNSIYPTPVSTPCETDRDSMVANNLQKSLSNIDDQVDYKSVLDTLKISDLSVSKEKEIYPIAMCYKKLMESGLLMYNVNGQLKTIKKDNRLALKIPIPNGLFLAHKLEKSISRSPGFDLDHPKTLSTCSPVDSKNSDYLTQNQHVIAPKKRKRSAIFIPPMNADNSKSPATEVSICKFKFTGGCKPSLEEKKMISVDADGNYRYYSGTGDKSSRGFEYFPRESLQQVAGLLPRLNCSGQKLCIDISPSLTGLDNDLLQIPASSTINVSMDSISTTTNTPFQPNNISNKSLHGTI